MSATATPPPEGVSGKMVFDEVAEGLRRYKAARKEAVQRSLLERLGPIRDARVAVFLGEMAADDTSPFHLTACFLLNVHHVPAAWDGGEFVGRTRAIDWWQKNKADLRCHAKQLPQ